MSPLSEQESTPFGQEILNDPEFFNQVQDSVGKEDVLFAKIEADHQQVKPFFMTFYIAPVEGEKSI